MCRCESWTIQKAKHWCFDAFILWCWRRVLRFPQTERRSNQPILKKINLEYSLESLVLKLQLQYFGHVMWRADSLEKTLGWERLRVGGEGDDRGWDDWMTSSTQWKWIWANCGREWRTRKPGTLQFMGSHGHSQIQLSNDIVRAELRARAPPSYPLS